MQARLLLAGALGVGGLVFALFQLAPWRSVSGTPSPAGTDLLREVEERDHGIVRSARLIHQPGTDPEAIAAAVGGFRDALRSTLASDPIDLEVTSREIEALVALACERLELLLSADYDAYVGHVQRLTRLPLNSEALRKRLMPRDTWEKYAHPFIGCSIDPSKAEVRVAYRKGTAVDTGIFAGHMLTAEHSTHPFVELGLGFPDLDKPADVVDVRVPIGTRDSRTNEPITVFFVVRLARLPSATNWVPWQVTVNTPTDEGYVLPPPL
jgi:hypothetical protein